MDKKYVLAVIGNPIAHSLSPQIHHAFAQQCNIFANYDKILASPDDFDKTVCDFFAQHGHGLNITVPFKQQAFKLCDDRLTRRAQAAGAVNTLLYVLNQSEGLIYGDNTDGQGMVNAINKLGWRLNQARVAMVGAGGAARGTLLPLLDAGVVDVVLANRTESKAKQMAHEFNTLATGERVSSSSIEGLEGKFDLIINATSASLSGAALVFSKKLTARYAYDMVYQKSGNPTPFMSHFAAKGATVADGLGMLIEQAAISFSIWTGATPDIGAINFAFLRQ